jgi:20S proteasome subunit beta 4
LSLGATIKFKFNCILIDASGIHRINLDSSDPINEMEQEGKAAEIVTPNPPIDVGVTATAA